MPSGGELVRVSARPNVQTQMTWLCGGGPLLHTSYIYIFLWMGYQPEGHFKVFKKFMLQAFHNVSYD